MRELAKTDNACRGLPFGQCVSALLGAVVQYYPQDERRAEWRLGGAAMKHLTTALLATALVAGLTAWTTVSAQTPQAPTTPQSGAETQQGRPAKLSGLPDLPVFSQFGGFG